MPQKLRKPPKDIDYIQVFLDEKSLSVRPTTLKTYTMILGQYRAFLRTRGVKNVENAQKSDILAYISYIEKERQGNKANIESSRGNKLNLIKYFYEWLRDYGAEDGYEPVIERSPAKSIARIKRPERKPIYLNDVEKQAFLLAASVNPLDYLVCRLLISSGMRVSELLSLRKGNIDFDRNEIRVIGKGNKERILPLNEKLKPDIQAYCNRLKDEDRIYPYTKKNIEEHVKIIARRAGIKKNITPHKLRHTFASKFYSDTKDIKATQELLGHRSLNTTMIYTHLNMDDIKRQYSKANLL